MPRKRHELQSFGRSSPPSFPSSIISRTFTTIPLPESRECFVPQHVQHRGPSAGSEASHRSHEAHGAWDSLQAIPTPSDQWIRSRG